MKITPTRKGKKRTKDFRVRFDGEIRSAEGVWTEEECRAFVELFWRFLRKHGAVYHDFVIIATPGKGKRESDGRHC